MPPMSVMMKPASGLCNMSCDYCFYCDESSKRGQASYGLMSEETLRNVIRKTMLNASGQITYAYQGGEPSVRGLDFFRKAVELQQKYNRTGLRVNNAFQTNGYAIDEEWCRFFAENHFLVGLSVDGTQEIHDRYRHNQAGQPTYARVLEAARLMDRFQVDYNILTVVTKDIAEQIEAIYTDYKVRGWNYQQYIVCLDPLEEVRGQKPWSITPQLYGTFLTKLFHLWYQDWKRGQAPYIRQFENYIGILLGYQPEACDQRGFCQPQCIVEADGSVYPCDFYALDSWCLGNFNENKYAEIAKHPNNQAFTERSLKLEEDCRSCRHFALCRGGCQRHRDELPDGAYHNYFCESFRYFFDQCEAEMREIAEALQKRRR